MKEQVPYFIEVPRANPVEVPVSVRVLGWSEIYGSFDPGQGEEQSARWIDWPDFRLPRDRDDARAALVDAWCRSAEQRVEIACSGGRGRTGTALACLAVLDGVPPDEAVRYIRERYDRHAVETPGQDSRLAARRRHDRKLRAAVHPVLRREKGDASPIRAPVGRTAFALRRA